jgi:hypothetical protein
MAMADTHDQQQPSSQAGDKAKPGFFNRLLGFDSWLHSAASLSIVTLIAGWFGTYIQYLNAYEQKVSETAQLDMRDATAAFVEISNAYAEAQMLQQLIYFNYVAAANDKSDAGNKGMVTKAGQDIYPGYIKGRYELRKNANIHFRKAELYIDWPSNLDRDPAATTAYDGDPLTESLLGDYNFDCDAKENFPHYEAATPVDQAGKSAGAGKPQYTEEASQKACLAPNETQKQIVMGSRTVVCAVDDNGRIDHARPSREINWHSAKHHLIVMHYCFELTHGRISTARIWASQNEVSEEKKSDFLKSKDTYHDSLDHEVVRLDAFLSLVMSQLERIRVKYRPSSFYCNLPLINYAISDRCNPVRIAKRGAGG